MGVYVIQFELPYPPTNNTYYRHCRGRTFIGAKGRKYRNDVFGCLVEQLGKIKTLKGRLDVSVWAIMPDKRKRDVDNIFKGVGDSLQNAGLFMDDSQIDRLEIIRRPDEKPGRLLIWIREL